MTVVAQTLKMAHNFDVHPVPVSFFKCTFPPHTPLGLNIVPRPLSYETTLGRKNVSCCTVVTSSRREIVPGDILVKVSEVNLVGMPTSNLDEFFTDTMRKLSNTLSSRTVLFLRPAGSTAGYITGLSKELVVRLNAEEESIFADFFAPPSLERIILEPYSPIMQQSPGPTTVSITKPPPLFSLPPPLPKMVYRTEEEEIEKKVEERLAAVAANAQAIKTRRLEEEGKARADREFERVARYEAVKKIAEEDARNAYEQTRAHELMVIENARKAVEAEKRAEENARAKRVAESVQRRVDEESRRIAEEQEVLLVVELELCRLAEIKSKADDDARIIRVAEESKKRIQQELEKIAKREDEQRIAAEQELVNAQLEAARKLEDDAKYAAEEAVRQKEAAEAFNAANEIRREELKAQLQERRKAAESEVGQIQDADYLKKIKEQELQHIMELDQGRYLVKEAERLTEVNQKVEEDKAREKRVNDEVKRRIQDEKKRVLDLIEKKVAQDDELASASGGAYNGNMSSLAQHVSGGGKMQSDAAMEQWLQSEVQKRVAAEVKRRVEAVTGRPAAAPAPKPLPAPVQPRVSSEAAPATLFETTFPDKHPMGLTLVPHTINFTDPDGHSKSIYCCMVEKSSLTSDIEMGDVAISINGMPMMTISDPMITAETNLNAALQTLSQIKSHRTIRFFRADRDISHDLSSSAVSFRAAAMMIQNHFNLN